MKSFLPLFSAALVLALLAPVRLFAADVPKEIPLWPEGVPGIKADTSDETVAGHDLHAHAPSGAVLPRAQARDGQRHGGHLCARRAAMCM
jgi:hypothetical protein